MATKLLLTLAGVAVLAMPAGSVLAQDAPEKERVGGISDAVDDLREKVRERVRGINDSVGDLGEAISRARCLLSEKGIGVGLSEEKQLACDRLRFGDRHFNRVRLTRDGVVKSIHLHDGTSREVFTSFPYGIDFAAWDESESERRMEVEDLADFLKGRRTPGSRRSALGAAPAGFATGRPIGWNESTGLAPGDCLNYTIQTPSDSVGQASFSSENAASSTAEQIKASATVSVAFGEFKADNDFSFSDQWKSSSNSSNQYYNFFSLFTLNSTVDSSTPLNRQGQGATTNFDTLCGSQYLSSVQVGMVATISIAYGSTSSETQTEISDTFKGSFGLQSFGAAVNVSTQASDAESHFLVVVNHYGGGTDAAQALNNAFAAGDAKGAFYAQCAQGDGAACTQFTSSMGSGATAAINSFNNLVAGLSGATDPDLSFLQIFPDGVAGATATTRVESPIPQSSTSEILAPFKDKIDTYVKLLNEIATLDNRVTELIHLTNRTTFNPTEVLDLVDYLNDLSDVYHADRGTLVTNLQTCLRATSANVDAACKPIGDNTATNAFQYYKAEPSSCADADACFFAEQNTLALQYTGIYNQPRTSAAISLDGLYIDVLPPFERQNRPEIAGQAALAAFADRPWPLAAFDVTNPPGASTAAFISIVALEPGKPLSTTSLSPKVAPNPPDLAWWLVHPAPNFSPLENEPASITSRPCTPSFTRPCVIDIGSENEQSDFSISHTPIRGLFE